MVKSFDDCVKAAATWDKENEEIDLNPNIILEVEGKKYKAYTVSICKCDLLFYCETATVTYDIDIYYGNPVAVLRDVIDD